MFLRLAALFFAIVFLAGCPKPEKKPNSAKGKEKPQIKDQNGDASFEAFLGRLRKAAEARDKVMLVSMMAPDFGYRWDNAPDGETAFAYWDRNKLWGQLVSVLRERFTPHDAFMVAPPQFAQNENYPGYRAGLRMVNGSWRFAYFVPAPPAGEAAQPDAPVSHDDKPLPPLPE
ncbi:MAG: hypothetical protein ABIP20_21540 [Chthoniobacteraceae bacterium]